MIPLSTNKYCLTTIKNLQWFTRGFFVWKLQISCPFNQDPEILKPYLSKTDELFMRDPKENLLYLGKYKKLFKFLHVIRIHDTKKI